MIIWWLLAKIWTLEVFVGWLLDILENINKIAWLLTTILYLDFNKLEIHDIF